MNFFKTTFFCLAVSFSLSAAAQRPTVPLVDFKDIPVAAATAKKLTIDQVEQAIRAAALYEHWEVVSLGAGVLQATYVKQDKHTVVVTIDYSAEKYSVYYKDSVNMKFEADYSGSYTYVPPWAQKPGGDPDMEADRQRRRFRKSQESQNATVRTGGIHPYYERWVHGLLNDVRRKLQAIP